jgi:hypothetical protein
MFASHNQQTLLSLPAAIGKCSNTSGGGGNTFFFFFLFIFFFP